MGAPSATGASRSTAASTAQDRIARHQHATEILRARSVLVVACVLWLACGTGLDLAFHGTIGHGPLWLLFVLRWGASAYHVLVLALLFRHPLPAPALARPLIMSVFPVTSLALAIISSRMGGLASPYVTGTFVVIIAQGMAMPQPWRRASALAALTVALHPIGLLIAAGFDQRVRAQFDQPVMLAHFIIYVAVLAAGAIVVAWGSHVIWSLRQSVFESRSIGRYKLLRRIGKGGMGEVWRAHDKAMRRDVALKILNPEQGKNPSAVARFEREIQATAELVHPNTVRIHDWGVTDDGVWYYAMELLDGVDLSTLVKRSGPLPPALVIHLGVQAARAIAEAHGRGIIHRDLKPGNLFVVSVGGEADFAKVLDFGVARFGDDDAELTAAGAVVGTPGYMAPEVLAGAPGGLSGDVYGLCATLFFALTGKNPRDAGPGVPPSALVPDLPADLDALICLGLDADPGRRPASAGELASELSACASAGAWAGGWRLEPPPAVEGPGLDATVDADAPATRADGPMARGATGR